MWREWFVLAVVLPSLHALAFDVTNSDLKCICEEFGVNRWVSGIFFTTTPQSSVEVQVLDPELKPVVEQTANAGKFAFTTLYGGDYSFCFVGLRSGPSTIRVKLVLDIVSDNVKDPAAVVDLQDKKAHLDSLMKDLHSMEQTALQLQQDAQQMVVEEQHLRLANHSTNWRISWSFGVSVALLFLLGVTQTVYLTFYFKSKKIA